MVKKGLSLPGFTTPAGIGLTYIRLLDDFPFVRVPERVNTGEFYTLQAAADRPQVGVLPHADVDVIIIHDLLDLVEQLLASYRIDTGSLLFKQLIKRRIAISLIIGAIRIVRVDNLRARKRVSVRVGISILHA